MQESWWYAKQQSVFLEFVFQALQGLNEESLDEEAKKALNRAKTILNHKKH